MCGQSRRRCGQYSDAVKFGADVRVPVQVSFSPTSDVGHSPGLEVGHSRRRRGSPIFGYKVRGRCDLVEVRCSFVSSQCGQVLAQM